MEMREREFNLAEKASVPFEEPLQVALWLAHGKSKLVPY